MPPQISVVACRVAPVNARAHTISLYRILRMLGSGWVLHEECGWQPSVHHTRRFFGPTFWRNKFNHFTTTELDHTLRVPVFRTTTVTVTHQTHPCRSVSRSQVCRQRCAVAGHITLGCVGVVWLFAACSRRCSAAHVSSPTPGFVGVERPSRTLCLNAVRTPSFGWGLLSCTSVRCFGVFAALCVHLVVMAVRCLAALPLPRGCQHPRLALHYMSSVLWWLWRCADNGLSPARSPDG